MDAAGFFVVCLIVALAFACLCVFDKHSQLKDAYKRIAELRNELFDLRAGKLKRDGRGRFVKPD